MNNAANTKRFARNVSILFALSMISMVVTAPVWVPLSAACALYDWLKK